MSSNKYRCNKGSLNGNYITPEGNSEPLEKYLYRSGQRKVAKYKRYNVTYEVYSLVNGVYEYDYTFTRTEDDKGKVYKK